MSINLAKGQRIDLTKENPKLSKMIIGLGWDPEERSGGFFSSLRSRDIDCDASAFMLDENDKLKESKDVIYFGHLKSDCGSIKHLGDNLTGDGDGDDEQIVVNLNKVPKNISKIVFVVNIYDCKHRKQHFGMIKNAFIRGVDTSNDKELMIYNLTENYSGKTAMIFGELYRYNGEWKFKAIGEGTTDYGINDLAERYR